LKTHLSLNSLLWAALLWLAAPAFASDTILRQFSGESASIQDYAGQGQWLAVMYWTSDCQVCNVEAGNYADFHRRHRDGNASVLGISLDGAAGKQDAQRFIERHGLDFPNLIGEADLVALQYTTLTGDARFGTPSFLLYDPHGRLVAAQLGALRVPMLEKYIREHSDVE
jgi:peroxiredoxin